MPCPAPGSLSVPGGAQRGQGSGLLVMWLRMDAGGAWGLGPGGGVLPWGLVASAGRGGEVVGEGESPAAAGGRRGRALRDGGCGTRASVALRAGCTAAGALRAGGGVFRNGALGTQGVLWGLRGRAGQRTWSGVLRKSGHSGDG